MREGHTRGGLCYVERGEELFDQVNDIDYKYREGGGDNRDNNRVSSEIRIDSLWRGKKEIMCMYSSRNTKNEFKSHCWKERKVIVNIFCYKRVRAAMIGTRALLPLLGQVALEWVKQFQRWKSHLKKLM